VRDSNSASPLRVRQKAWEAPYKLVRHMMDTVLKLPRRIFNNLAFLVMEDLTPTPMTTNRPSPKLTVFCLAIDVSDSPIRIAIENDKTVYDLRNEIQKTKSGAFGNVDVDDIKLWKVLRCFQSPCLSLWLTSLQLSPPELIAPEHSLRARIQQRGADISTSVSRLTVTDRLSAVFPEPVSNQHVYVIVKKDTREYK
jgi:hypothetical protein